MHRVRTWTAILVLNGLLAGLTQLMAPAQPVRSDRQEYEFVGQHALEANCGWSVYCYRVLVPVLLEQIPLEPDTRWRWFRWVANTAAGAIVAGTTAVQVGGASPLIVTVIVQLSFGFAFTAYDPYSAEPMVYLLSAILAWCWLSDRWLAALAAGVLGVFAKETVALMSGSLALASFVERRAGWPRWFIQAAIVAITLLGFHWLMDTYRGWDMTTNAAADFSSGSWLALWWANNPSLLRKMFFLFMPFGFVWLYAAVGFRMAPAPLRALAMGAALPFLALNYVQNPERALANVFFIVAPLAAVLLSRVPVAVAIAAVVTNGLVTAKVGTATTWLPGTPYLIVPATAAAVWVFWCLRNGAAPAMVERAPIVVGAESV